MLEFVNAQLFGLQATTFPLWEIVMKSTMAIGLAALACRLLQRQSAAVRHRIWVFGLAAALIVPLATLWLPRLALSVLPAKNGTTTFSETPHVGASSRGIVPQRFVPDPLDGAATGMPAHSPSNTALPIDPSNLDQNTASVLETISSPQGIQRTLIGFWVIGSLASLSLLLISSCRLSIRLRRLRTIDDHDWNESMANAARTLGLRRPIETLESAEAVVPAVIGVFAPRLMVPHNWRTWSPAQRRCILLHELAHVKRCDILTQLLGRVASILYWFHPLVWHAVKQLRVERELAADDCVLLAGQSASHYAEQLLQTLKGCRPAAIAVGVAMAHSARLDHRVLAILDPHRRRDPVGTRFAMLWPCLVGVCCSLLGACTLSAQEALAELPADSKTVNQTDQPKPTRQIWEERYTVEYPGSLPVSVSFSADGKELLTGDTSGEVMALIFVGDEPQWRWKSKVEGAHAAAIFSADQKQVYSTTEHGIRILGAAQGLEEARIEVKDSNPSAIGIFPDKIIGETHTRAQIVFGNPRGYFVKSWVQDKLADTIGTIETSTVAKELQPADGTGVPLAVDPLGRSAIMTGPIDATGEVSGVKGKNVLWAYVCGDYGSDSPGNRVMVGHTAPVVSAAWAKSGKTAITGDANGRVIVWNAATMKETGLAFEFGGRVAALAISDDGQRAAAYVLGKEGALFVWETANMLSVMTPMHIELGDFAGPQVYASLAFSPDGRRLAGCAINKLWLGRLGELSGHVRVWELSNEPIAQRPPQPVFSKALPAGSSPHFVILDNRSVLTAASREGAIDIRDIADGGIQSRLVLGKFRIGEMKLSADRKWLAVEQRAPLAPGTPEPAEAEFEVGIYETLLEQRGTIPSCRQLLDIASGGKHVAVVRAGGIEIWDRAAAKVLRSAPFEQSRIDAAAFSPDGKLLAISDHNDLVLWSWEENKHARFAMEYKVEARDVALDMNSQVTFKLPPQSLQIRYVATRQIVWTLDDGTTQSMNVPRIVLASGGRIVFTGDELDNARDAVTAHRIALWDARWDTATGGIAHQIPLPAGVVPSDLHITPNGRFLVALLQDGDSGMQLSVWRLDGEVPVNEPVQNPPASERAE